MSPTINANVKWADNTDQLKQRLLEGTGQIIAMKDAVDRTAAAMGGSGLLAAANKVTAAIEQIGGVTKLTSSEIDRQTILIDKAIEKYQALGLAAPSAMKDLADQLHAAGGEADKTTGFFESMGHSFVARVAEGMLLRDAIREVLGVIKDVITAFPDLVEHTIAVGNSLFEMSMKTGASVEGLSALRYVASQTGIDFNSFGTTLSMMEKNLGATGAAGTKVSDTLKSMGLDLETVKNMRSDEAFIAIAQALEGVSNNADKAHDAALLMGRGAKEMAALWHDDIGQMIQDAHDLGLVMSTEQAAAAHAAEVGWKSFTMQLEAAGMSIATKVLPMLVALEQLAGQAFSALQSAYAKSGDVVGDGKVSSAIDDIGETLIASAAAAAGFAAGATAGLQNVLDFAIRTGQALVNLGAILIKVASLGTVDEAGKTFLDKTQKALHDSYDALEILKTGVDQTSDVAQKAFGAVEQVADGMAGKFHDAYAKAAATIQKFADQSRAAAGGFSDDFDAIDKKVVSVTATSIAKTQQLHDEFLAMVDKGNNEALAAKLDADQKWLDGETSRLDQSKAKNKNYWNELGAILDLYYAKVGTDTEQAMLKVETNTNATIATLQKLGTAIPQKFFEDQIAMNKQWTLATGDAADLTDAMTKLGPIMGKVYKDVNVELDKSIEKHKVWLSELSELSTAFTQLATAMGGAFGGFLKDIGTAISQLNLVNVALDKMEMAKLNRDAFGQIAAGASAVAPALGLVSTAGNYADQGSEVLNHALGLGLDPNDMLKNANAASDFIKQLGGIDAITQKTGISAQKLNQDFFQALQAKTPQDFAAAFADVTDALSQANIKATDLAAQVTGIQGLAAAYVSAGHVMPAAMVATIQQLEKMPGLTDAERLSLKSLVDSAKPNFENLESKAAGLGITLAQLGPKFEQGDLTQKFGDVWQNITDLVNAGGDLTGILEGYTPAINSLVNESIQFGTTIPDNMKPWLQKMADAGELTDSAGDKIKDLSGVKFAPTMQTSLDAMNTSIGLLTGVLDKLPAMIAAAFQAANGNPFAQWSLEGLDAAGNAFNPIVNLPDTPAGVPISGPGASFVDTSHINPATGVPYKTFSTGGMFTPSGDVQYFADGYPGGGKILQFAPRGADVQPAMIGLDEMVLNANQQKAVGALIKRGTGAGSRAGGATAPASAAPSITFHLSITVPPGQDAKATASAVADAVQTTVERKLIPALTKALQDNRGGARTHMLEALGIAS